MAVSGIRPIQTPAVQASQALRSSAAAASKDPVGQVSQTFSQVLDSLSQSEISSDNLMQKLAAGEEVDIHQLMIATEETNVNFKVAMGIRDKLVEAYREMMRMNV
jgi:flagellar hook-basal body complex protein FliE